MKEVGGTVIFVWNARDGQLDSGWIRDLYITREVVWVTVAFLPADGGPSIPIEIINPAGGTSYGWLQRGICHAIEIQFRSDS